MSTANPNIRELSSDLSDSLSSLDFSHLRVKRLENTLLARPLEGKRSMHFTLTALPSSHSALKWAALTVLARYPRPGALSAPLSLCRRREALVGRRETFFGLLARTDPKKVSRASMKPLTEPVY
jgi:hypothetical protein